MNRRSFLSKICALLPFGLGLAFTGDSGASKGQPRPKCSNLAISTDLKCTPEMINLCEQEDGILCNGHGQAEEKPKRLDVGQVWKGQCLTSYEPNLEFYYILLSAGKGKDGLYWWSASEHMSGVFGSGVRKFLGYEIRKLEYVGHITELEKCQPRP